ncbi:DapH/DapD/GlmU-related protein [Kitasatospora sp. NPDC048545]|uniref:DapH/DapD/GlmU-related protein n=1 Tax=Kitasatospora sp. NPDC048545 TaxID=3157208 RepID=UPI0033CC5159
MAVSSAVARLRHQLRGIPIRAGVSIGRGTRIDASEVEIGPGVVIGRDVRIEADRVLLAADTHIGDRCRITARAVRFAYNCVLFPDVVVHSLGDVQFGEHAKISRDAVLKAGSITTGVEFWMNRRAEIGGGGWRTGDGFFQAGDRCHVGRSTHINTAHAVVLGDDTAIGMDCTVATHAHWQPVTDGFPYGHGPVTLGSNVAVYSRSIISPGVTIGDGATTAAGSVVVRDVPERGLVGGAPARLIRIQEPPPSPLPVLLDSLDAYVTRRWPEVGWKTDHLGQRTAHGPGGAKLILASDRVLTVAAPFAGGIRQCSFDISRMVLSGTSSDLSESVRNHLFSIGLRFRYDGYRRARIDARALQASGMEE